MEDDSLDFLIVRLRLLVTMFRKTIWKLGTQTWEYAAFDSWEYAAFDAFRRWVRAAFQFRCDTIAE